MTPAEMRALADVGDALVGAMRDAADEIERLQSESTPVGRAIPGALAELAEQYHLERDAALSELAEIRLAFASISTRLDDVSRERDAAERAADTPCLCCRDVGADCQDGCRCRRVMEDK